MDETRLLIVAIEMLRKQIADLKLSTIANSTRDNDPSKPSLFNTAQNNPGLTAFNMPGAIYDKPIGPQNKPKEKKPETTGFLTDGWKQLVGAVQSILGTIKASKASKVVGAAANKARGAFARVKGSFKRLGKKFKNSTVGKKLTKDFGTVKKVLGKVGGSKVGRAVKGAVGAGGNAAGKLLGMIGGMFGKVLGMLGPVALLAAVIESNLSGVQLVMSAFKLLAATLAPLFLPVMILLATGLTELSDTIWDEIKPALGDFYDIIFSTLLPVLSMMVQAFRDAINIVRGWFGLDPIGSDKEESQEETGAGDYSGHERGEAPELAPGGGSFSSGGFTPGTGPPGDRGDVRPSPGGESGDGSPAGPRGEVRPSESGDGVGSRTRGAFSDVIREFRMSVAPKASMSGLADVGKNIQVNALNKTPFEQKMLERVQGCLDALNNMDRKTHPPRRGGAYDERGAGDFSGDSGVGGSF